MWIVSGRIFCSLQRSLLTIWAELQREPLVHWCLEFRLRLSLLSKLWMDGVMPDILGVHSLAMRRSACLYGSPLLTRWRSVAQASEWVIWLPYWQTRQHLTSGQALGRRRNKITELGVTNRQCSHISGSEGDQNEEPAATIMLDALVLKMLRPCHSPGRSVRWPRTTSDGRYDSDWTYTISALVIFFSEFELHSSCGADFKYQDSESSDMSWP